LIFIILTFLMALFIGAVMVTVMSGMLTPLINILVAQAPAYYSDTGTTFLSSIVYWYPGILITIFLFWVYIQSHIEAERAQF
jgi:hypothetical protein